MNSTTKENPRLFPRTVNLLLITSSLLFAGTTQVFSQQTPGVLPPKSQPYGKTYSEWSAAWWQWALGLPVDGHPFNSDPNPDFRIDAGQSGQVWLLGAPFGTTVRNSTIPVGKALLFGLLNSEWSSLEGYATEAEQRAAANLFTDHIVNLFCSIDGVAVMKLSSYRADSAQFTFTAPTPWIFGDTAGTGTSVASGYYIFLAPLSAGKHTVHFGGSFHFAISEGDDFDFDASLDMTYNLTVR